MPDISVSAGFAIGLVFGVVGLLSGFCLMSSLRDWWTANDGRKIRSYAVGVFLMTVVGFVLYGSMVLLPIMLQTLLGYPPLQAGIAMAPRGIGSFFMMPITGLMTGRFDPRKLLTAGLLVGGTSKIPLIRRYVSEKMAGKEAESFERIDPMTCVAQGAAVVSAILQGAPGLDNFAYRDDM